MKCAQLGEGEERLIIASQDKVVKCGGRFLFFINRYRQAVMNSGKAILSHPFKDPYGRGQVISLSKAVLKNRFIFQIYAYCGNYSKVPYR